MEMDIAELYQIVGQQHLELMLLRRALAQAQARIAELEAERD